LRFSSAVSNCEQDFQIAKKYLQLAAEKNNGGAKTLLKLIENHIEQ
jgi:TPR repeat protein